ncbi:hypothetical protein [Bacillus benzoevorans]|uniref:Uncharacterized protein n=1 Tax=Bacillus benzoevorans TaxID=1456 RepID=A0A7X0HT94_9BACI|nr:hypothetical protein [Bacillus benzoevorans]MBB6446371.1 hypothetical protein [Bacillus benzoevorans]
MFAFESEVMLVQDREDLIAVLQMRFGNITGAMIEEVYAIDDLHTLQRLILAAANSADWHVFLEEFYAGNNSIRIVGENFNPLRDLLKGRGDINGTKEK